MIRFLLILVSTGILFTLLDCSKKNPGSFYCTNAPISYDTAAMRSFAQLNGLSVVQDSSGLNYQIVGSGYGSVPNLKSTIYVTYIGALLDGTIFDSTSNAAKTGFVLDSLLKCWQIGIPKIRVGGRIKLLSPSALGYGCAGYGTMVPPNSPLFYDVTLDSIH
jgi:FKBP-type peptidyl-prolyl cis-trans isomerase FkpA